MEFLLMFALTIGIWFYIGYIVGQPAETYNEIKQRLEEAETLLTKCTLEVKKKTKKEIHTFICSNK